ncbi:Germin-like protein 1-3 [Triticum urartu]|uniref:Germin-like protein 1-3 n=1 Tax=Triticum urartu TaxID=4572 RepID=M8AC31_TRIUA|nr:Germin-like protein 1-3 [Triticum urartu]
MAPKQLPAVLLATCATLLALAAPLLAGDPDMLQDFCVADYKSLDGPLRLNGFPCKRPENVTADDFFSAALAFPGNTGNPVGSMVTAANVEKLPGLNTLGVSLSRVDYAPWGVNPPHTHPRATEIIYMLEGSLDVGTASLAVAMFGASPPVPTDVLARALQIDGGLVEAIKSKFPTK